MVCQQAVECVSEPWVFFLDVFLASVKEWRLLVEVASVVKCR